MEHLHFNATCRAKEGERAVILGYPVFLGLNAGNEGVMFKCYTVNVKNESAEALLKFLDSDVFKAGLKLAKTAQPAIAPLSEMALGLTRGIAERNKNEPVQNFCMGLDFSTIPTQARLAEGSHIAVQIPEALQTMWDWQDWVYYQFAIEKILASRKKRGFRVFKKPDFSEKSGFSEKLMFQINGELVYHPGNGQIVNKEDSTKLIPYNFMVFSVSRYEG